MSNVENVLSEFLRISRTFSCSRSRYHSRIFLIMLFVYCISTNIIYCNSCDNFFQLYNDDTSLRLLDSFARHESCWKINHVNKITICAILFTTFWLKQYLLQATRKERYFKLGIVYFYLVHLDVYILNCSIFILYISFLSF